MKNGRTIVNRAIALNNRGIKRSWNIEPQTVNYGHSELREESLRDLSAKAGELHFVQHDSEVKF
jgi:hypothetical protein